MDNEPTFLTVQDVILLNVNQLRVYGHGEIGLLSGDMLKSAIAAPLQEYHYGTPDLYELAAVYAFHLCQAHAFINGNKRTALASAILFLNLNDLEVDLDPDELADPGH